MAQFTNQAQLSYNGISVLSNTAVGDLQEVLSVSKHAVNETYQPGDTITYSVSLINSGATPVTGITVTDDLGAVTDGTNTVYPLTYVPDTATLYVGGVLAENLTVTNAPALTVSNITIPAESEAVLVYQATANEYAPIGGAGDIVNTVTATGNGIINPVTATATVSQNQEPQLSITKSISPVPVVENGTITYTFLIENSGATAADAGANVVVSDTFNPILSNLTATLNGVTLSPTTDYSYDAATGAFATNAGVITVPAATYAQNQTTRAYSTTPGSTTLVVTGTV